MPQPSSLRSNHTSRPTEIAKASTCVVSITGNVQSDSRMPVPRLLVCIQWMMAGTSDMQELLIAQNRAVCQWLTRFKISNFGISSLHMSGCSPGATARSQKSIETLHWKFQDWRFEIG